MARVLITGAAGFIGMHTAIRFLKEGWEVIGLDNMNDYYSVQLKEDRLKEIESVSNSLKQKFVFYRKDLNSDILDTLGELHFDALIHLAAQAGVRYSIENPMAYLESNIIGFQKVLNFVSIQNIERFIYASSSSVYGKDSEQPFSESAPCNSPESYYAATKKANELMAKAYNNTHGISSIGLRFFTVYGPWGRPDMAPMLFVKAGTDNQTIKVFNHGKQERDFTYIDDIVEGIFLLTSMENFPCQSLVCNIGNGAPVGLMQFIAILEKSIGKIFNKEFVQAQKGDVETTFADTSLLNSLVNYYPQTTLDRGIPIFVQWYKEYFSIN